MKRIALLTIIGVVVVVAAFAIEQSSSTVNVEFGTSPASSTPPARPRTVPAASTSTTTVPLRPSAVATTCVAYLFNHDATVSFGSGSYDVTPLCREWIRTSAQAGELWTNQPQPEPTGESIICRLRDPRSDATALVADDGGEIYGTSACTALLADGWIDA